MGVLTYFYLLFIVIAFGAANPSCPKIEPGVINVHLVCHTHNDVGWLKTVDQYYYGYRNNIQRAGVQYILDSVIVELQKNATRKFSYVEMAFFERWWNEQDEKTKEIVKSLVANGQLELVNGGWCMNDEAAAHYSAIIDQMTVGLRFINNTFGTSARPRVAWQIDPFGHSSGQASIFAQMGFDGLFFGRLDYADKKKRWDTKSMEIVWRGSQSLGEAASLFTGALPNNYSPPKGFCFDDLCTDAPIMDDETMEDYNVGKRIEDFIKIVKDQAKAYRSNNIVMTMGEDFNYQNANMWFKNLDKLIHYMNEAKKRGSNINVFYSTPSCYLDSLHAANLLWDIKQDDFFPYASDPHAYWTGYFTSRPALKGYIRKSNGNLQGYKQIASMYTGDNQMTSWIEKYSKVLAVEQHHDAVTGTAKQHVTDDYVKRMSDMLSPEHFRELNPIKKFYLNLNENGIDQKLDISHSEFTFCPNVNISSCTFLDDKAEFEIMIYNPIARPLSKYIRFPVLGNRSYEITDIYGKKIESQIVPIPSMVMNIPYRKSMSANEVVFYAKDVLSLGMTVFKVKRKSSFTEEELSRKSVIESGVNPLAKFGFDTVIQMLYYPAMKGDNTRDIYRASGAYIFRPNGTKAILMGDPTHTQYEGSLLTEIHTTWNSWGTVITKIYREYKHVELDWIVGPIPIHDKIGKEVVIRYKTNKIRNNGVFYTDANGREMQKRVLNHRDTWKLNVTEPISANYYPVTTKIMISSTDGKKHTAVLTDRSEGGTSLKNGEIELMVHRRLLHDDAFGVGEALNETEFGEGLIVRGTHLLVDSEMSPENCSFTCHHTRLAEKMMMQFDLQFGFKSPDVNPSSFLVAPLPEQIHLLTLEPTDIKHQVLMRLEHMYEKNSDPKLSVPVTLNLKDIFSQLNIRDVVETTLAGDQYLSDSKRLHWNVAKSHEDIDRSDKEYTLRNIFFSRNLEFRKQIMEFENSEDDGHSSIIKELLKQESIKEQNLLLQNDRFNVTLNPFQIRTFLLYLN